MPLPDAFLNLPQPTVGDVSVRLHESEEHGQTAIVDFGGEVTMHVRTAKKARKLAQVFASASMMLDPQAPLQLAAEAVKDAEPGLPSGDLDDGMDDRFDGPDDGPELAERPPSFGPTPWQPPLAAVPDLFCADCGVPERDVPMVSDAGVLRCFNLTQCRDRQAAKAGACPRCGASERGEAIGSDGHCLNTGACGRRAQAAKAGATS